jgi:hypothetical protein
VPPAEHVHTASTTVVGGPSPTPTMKNQDRGEATVEGEVASRREPPWLVQVDHPASRIIGNMNERTTRSRVRNNSHFAHAAFVATFEPKDIGHALSDHNWVNSVTEPLKLIPYYCLNHSSWPLSNNIEVTCRLCRVVPGKSLTSQDRHLYNKLTRRRVQR